MRDDKVIHIKLKTNINHASAGDLIDSTVKSRDNNGNGGEPPMDKYATHQELEASTEKILHLMDNHFADIQHQLDQHFNKIDKHFSNVNLQIHDTKTTAQNNKEKINWVLYTAVGGIIISVITTIISNLLTK